MGEELFVKLLEDPVMKYLYRGNSLIYKGETSTIFLMYFRSSVSTVVWGKKIWTRRARVVKLVENEVKQQGVVGVGKLIQKWPATYSLWIYHRRVDTENSEVFSVYSVVVVSAMVTRVIGGVEPYPSHDLELRWP